MFALALRDRASHVTLVERQGLSAMDAEVNLAGTGHVITGDAGKVADAIESVDTLVVDPPRSGLGRDVIEKVIHQWRPETLIYVSCSPATLVRDMTLLVQGGFTPHSFTPVDLFPHTPHVEVVTHFTRRDPGEGSVGPTPSDRG